MVKYEPWQVWERQPEIESTLELRAKAELPEMESTKQLVKLISEVYRPGMRILDVGCNVGHYLHGLRRLDPKLCYVGVDAYPYYIEKAKAIFGEDDKTTFLVKDIMKPLFPTPFLTDVNSLAITSGLNSSCITSTLQPKSPVMKSTTLSNL
ncbi:hypothetical protein ES703_97494 [subsurface metagenome]